jgi:hypothetical protein
VAGDLNTKHPDRNSRLTTARDLLLRNYTNSNACLIYGPDSPVTVTYQNNVTSNIIDIVNDFIIPVHLAVCSALSSDHLPVLIDNACQTSFQILVERPDFT